MASVILVLFLEKKIDIYQTIILQCETCVANCKLHYEIVRFTSITIFTLDRKDLRRVYVRLTRAPNNDDATVYKSNYYCIISNTLHIGKRYRNAIK